MYKSGGKSTGNYAVNRIHWQIKDKEKHVLLEAINEIDDLKSDDTSLFVYSFRFKYKNTIKIEINKSEPIVCYFIYLYQFVFSFCRTIF